MKNKHKGMYIAQKDYVRGKIDAAGNPVEFRLSFDEWLNIWEASGKLSQRGIRKGCYVMSRYNDLGHYEVGNVFIQEHSDNVRQAQIGRQGYYRGGEKNPFYGKTHSEETLEKIKEARAKQIITNETKKKIGDAKRGKKQTPEQIAKRVEATRISKMKKKQEAFNGKKE